MTNSNKHWPVVLTILIVLAAAGISISFEQHEVLGNIGSMLSGVSGAIAFVWLIAGFQQQRKELSLQRKELRLQRDALEMQRVELARTARQAALTQVSTMMANFNASLPNKSVGEIRSIEDIGTQFIRIMPHWKIILESTDTEAVFDSYSLWSQVEGLALQSLAIFASAARLYEESTGAHIFVGNTDDVAFILQNAEILKGLPHLQQYFQTIFALAQDYSILQPAIKKVRLAGWAARQKMFPEAFGPETIEKLRQEEQGNK